VVQPNGTGCDRLGVRGLSGTGTGGSDRMGLGQGGLQIRWDRMGLGQGGLPVEPVHLS